LLIRRRKSSVHYQPNLSVELQRQLMVCAATRVHRVFASLWDKNACIGYGLVSIASYTRLTTSVNRFASHEYAIGEKRTDRVESPWGSPLCCWEADFHACFALR